MCDRWKPTVLIVSCVALGCASGLSSRRDATETAYRQREVDAQLQVQTALMRTEIDNLRARLLEKDRREAELWQGYMALMVRVNQLIAQQQQAQLSQDNAPNSVQLAGTPNQPERPIAAKALLRAINRMNITPEQRQSLIQLLSPPRTIDESNPWRGEATW